MPFPEYESYDAVGLAELIARGQISPEELLDAAVARIEARNPVINAVVFKAYDQARAAIRAGLPNGPLKGVPFLLKDLGAHCAGLPTTGGSRLFRDYVPDYDITLVKRYRAAGLVIAGKTNTPEFGFSATTEPELHGPTRNPWNPAYSAGGSSGGAAAAVAAGMVPAAHGTDGGGSIRIPAANCGLFGLKTTRGRTPQGPILGESLGGFGAAHVLTRSVRDSAVLLDISHGPEPGDPYAAPPVLRPFVQELGAPVGRLRIGLRTEVLPDISIHPDCLAAAEHAARLCESLGHIVEPMPLPYDARQLRDAFQSISSGGIAHTFAQQAASRGRPVTREDVELISWVSAEEGNRRTAREYAASVQFIQMMGRRIAAAFEPYDLMISPTIPQPPWPLGQVGARARDLESYNHDHVDYSGLTAVFNATGQPAMSVPLYWNQDGLPIGVQFAARFGDEALLFRMASTLEQVQPWADRRPVGLAVG